ncbi:MAG TPA: class I SAM-dependent methyltransferase [Vicinamibacterales bacterium]|nr:class I SAM-dependent methyltransferase [Vicinamibacterales bacterium]
MYAVDLAYVHDAGFGDLARQAAPAIVRLLRARGIRRGHLVEVGCGSGISAQHFCARGYAVTGIDASAAMIRLARGRAPRARFRVAGVERTRLPPCDVVIAVGEVVSYMPGGVPALRRFVRRVHDALRPGGLFVFDFIESAAGRTYRMRSTAGDDWALTARATFAQSRATLTRRIAVERRIGGRVRHSTEIHRVRVYSRGVVRDTLLHAGFLVSMSRSYGRYRLMAGDVAVVASRSARTGSFS